ncbi:hypothetical protein HBI56_179300 [Parastagonospora nodorum]|uniref:Acyl-coenzyme A thioesterase THEM4 n=2 Tax=Phaeosphaeria nodorum (strain SN15 / ATCC MYA-4574 / FGSC 10173) TaxID=321614 RepID=A0A7U2EX39_PHANO|nr:hypothetical protein SNOG_08299 [Parastagonospora nodorum SN15]KAH3917875.1 hypothetical protein HBH56_045960 [Parastagonospora nodorum]EAT84575.1 hypothetical protein SNOG_08299 [Parastagonospora nodorum SN15]KAH3933049.1 hypothetical protein HBH54_073710 [Parastagonospora nodorum]KAH3946429.1 hypothetical protein HBH53_132860 [Parastagonospora nodorum]KAH3973218.1 hypothetical protein HBH52_145760 [Parastagonospora nodorum]
MTDPSIARLNAIPWVASLIHDPKWTRVQTISRVLQSSGEDSFYSETLATDRTMRSCLTLLPAVEADAKIAFREVLWIVELGDGLNGYPGTLHGGMAATLLDEVCGILLQSNAAKASERARTGTTDRLDEYMTAYLNTTYKKPIPVPGTILCTARFEREEGRKLYVRGTIEDGSGTIYTIGEALFIKLKPKM